MQRAIVILIFLSSISCHRNLISVTIEEDKVLADSIQSIMQSNELYSEFNGSILVAKNDRIIVRLNYGFIDAEKSAPIDNDSRFNIGSAAKEIPAMALWSFIDKGLINYEDPINKFVQNLPDWSSKITIQNLLFYKSGLPPMNFLSSSNDENALRDLMDMDTLSFETGMTYLYSNFNNLLQTKIVESVVEMDFRAWAKANFFLPLQMNGAIYTSNPAGITDHGTKSYSEIYGDDEANNPNFKQFEFCYAPLYMTTQDLFKWMAFVQEKYNKKSAGRDIFYQQTHLNGLGPLGIIEKEKDDVIVHKHGGIAYFFETLMYRDYKNGTTIVIMTNSRKPNQLDKLKDEIIGVMDREF